ncbi:MAG: hypothetical protein AB7M12_02465 [Hyphomonadaceae bacterium]
MQAPYRRNAAARFAAALGLAGLLALTAACDRIPGFKPKAEAGKHVDPTDLITTPDTDVDDVASAEPGRDRRQWRPRTDLARAQTGSVTTSIELRGGPLMLAFGNGITVTAERDAELRGAEASGVSGQTFAVLMNLDPSARVFVYRVKDEQLAPAARAGLCGDGVTTFVAVSEFVGKDGEWALRVASFKGKTAPGAGVDPELCGAFQYAAA